MRSHFSLAALFRVCLIIYIPLAGSEVAHAQQIIKADHITIEDGLSQGHIGALFEDREGYMWIGTKNGLNRFDGEEFVIFTSDPFDPYSISNSWTASIVEIGDYLLVCAENGSLDLYAKRTQQFFNVPGCLEEFSHTGSYPILVKDSSEQVWIYSERMQKLVRIVFPDDFWESAPNDTAIGKIWFQRYPFNFRSYLGLTDQGKKMLYADSAFTIFQIDLKTGEQQLHSVQLPANFVPHKIALLRGETLVSYNYDNLAIHYQGKWRIEQPGFQMETIFPNPVSKHFGILATDGFYIFEHEFLAKKPFLTEHASGLIHEPGTSIIAFYPDRSGNYWFGTNGYGAMKVAPRRARIKEYFAGHSIYDKPFISSDGEILLRNPKPHTVLYHPATSRKLEKLAERMVPSNECHVFRGEGSRYWYISHETDGLVHISQFDASTGKVFELASFAAVANGLMAICHDPENEIILTATDGNLVEYMISDNSLRSFSFFHLAPGSRGYYCLEKIGPESYALGTPKGILMITKDRESYVFDLIQKKSDGSGLLNNEVSAILQDKGDKDLLWIGTKGGGLHSLRLSTMEYTHLNTRNGLPNDVIYGILDDDMGNLWMSTNKGIVRFEPGSSNIASFTGDDGMQSDEFNTYAYVKAPDGQLAFGGIYGLNMFHPEDLAPVTTLPKVWIKGLRANNQEIKPGDSTGILRHAMEYTTSVTLPYKQNNVSLSFVAIEFTAPFKNQYRYYLEGAETPWVHESRENTASYLNLSPGTYRFLVKGSNGDGIWNEEPASVVIHILPPWYTSRPALVLYGLLVLFAIWSVFRFRVRRVRMQAKMEMEQQEAERLKELDRVKTRLYTNITHEFRTPLTVISGIADSLDGNPREKDLIKRNSTQLLNLVNQMLELRKLESGAMPVMAEHGDLIRFVRYLCEACQPLAEGKNIDLAFRSDMEVLDMDFDREKLTRILTNLISNAIKFTPSGGSIRVMVLQEEGKESKALIKVTDTGIGIPEEKLGEIFDQFYQVDDSSTRAGEGTGIGLTLANELVQAIGGNIDVTSVVGQGSEFTVSLPITHVAPPADIEGTPLNGIREILAPQLKQENGTGLEQKDKEGQQVLIIEDNADVIHYLESCLDNRFQLHVARNGNEGIKLAFEVVPDAIISDIMMPEKDGFEVLDTLKNARETSHIPIILLTAKADVASRLEGLRRGADAYIPKPFDKEELQIELEKVIGIRKMLRERYKIPGELPATPDKDVQVEDAFITAFRKVVEQHLDDPDFDVEQLCREMGISRSNMHRKVTALTGMSTSAFQQTFRLKKAAELLRSDALSISEVAYEVGFRNPSYFSRAFSKAFGKSPSEFRES